LRVIKLGVRISITIQITVGHPPLEHAADVADMLGCSGSSSLFE
jgi:hypothetical protein